MTNTLAAREVGCWRARGYKAALPGHGATPRAKVLDGNRGSSSSRRRSRRVSAADRSFLVAGSTASGARPAVCTSPGSDSGEDLLHPEIATTPAIAHKMVSRMAIVHCSVRRRFSFP